jgi:hypothetical protein
MLRRCQVDRAGNPLDKHSQGQEWRPQHQQSQGCQFASQAASLGRTPAQTAEQSIEGVARQVAKGDQ